MAVVHHYGSRTPVPLLRLLLAVLLCAACTAAASPYTPAEDTHTRNFLLLLAKDLPALARIWDPSVDYCSWDGVSCKSKGVVINVSNLGLSGTLPELDASLNASRIYVSEIHVDGNPGVSGPLPPSWGSLAALTYFSSSDCSISGSVPSEWNAMSSLQSFEASNTSLSGTLPVEWCTMPKLWEFTADMTSLSGTLPPQWQSMQRMFYLNLSYTNVAGTLPPAWSHMTQLSHFDLSSTKVTGVLPVEWRGMTNLLYVNLSNTDIAGTLPPTWSTLGKFVVFDMSNTQLVGTLPSEWSSMQRLRQFDVSGTRLAGTLPPEWCVLQKLTRVLLAHTALNGTLPTEYGALHLEVLDVAHTGLSGTIPAAWGSLVNLTHVDFSETQVAGCLPKEWLCTLGLTTSGVGLSSAVSRGCPSAADVCGTAHSARGLTWWMIALIVLAGVLLLAALGWWFRSRANILPAGTPDVWNEQRGDAAETYLYTSLPEQEHSSNGDATSADVVVPVCGSKDRTS
ncbi:putative surface antigen protein [Leptomonas seymouri]|uniref:Putative surface antigen protein n=1 Tax=Leptomonas seymouri TaxID=5684 RepID=A0A0N1I7S5_LEPSE|nr:putative surface antigen protein [Leptomonas seymouri]|eukprot:KPI87472.1 putative surface antigen protein [Leptomonas seymouri]